MLDNLFSSVLFSESTSSGISGTGFLICTVCSLILGVLTALIYCYKNSRYSKGFIMTLILLPSIVQLVIMIVNGNLGVGVAVMGAFSLVRFRSVPGSAKEICSIFLAMAIGLATGMGYIGTAFVFVVIIGVISMLFTAADIKSKGDDEKLLKITVPESLNYTDVFEETLKSYTKAYKLLNVKTTNMGSLFKLDYIITMEKAKSEKELIDELRTKNGNLEISLGILPNEKEELL